MNFIKKLFKIAFFGFLGLIALSLVIGHIFAPSEEEMAKYRAERQEQEQKQEEESKARISAALKNNLENNRDEIIQEINDLIKNKDYVLAKNKAERFREFEDPKLKKLAELAATRQGEVVKAKRREEERRITAALQKVSKKTDKVEGIDWYSDKSSPSYNNANAFHLYIGKRPDRDPWLRLRIQYLGDKWLFISSFIVIADGNRFERPRAKFKRDHDTKIWEWYDESPTAADLVMIQAIIESKDAVIRFNGQQYHDDRKITPAQKAALQNVLDAYKVLGSK